jgi:hypothetical protein
MKLVVAMMLFACLANASAADESSSLVDNPEFLGWKSCPVGSSKKMSWEGSNAAIVTRMTITETLKSLDENEAVVEIEYTTMDGHAETSTQKVPARIEKAREGLIGKYKGRTKYQGEVDQHIGGKKYRCRVWSWTDDSGAHEINGMIYYADGIPGGVVKVYWRSETPKGRTELVQELKEFNNSK